MKFRNDVMRFVEFNRRKRNCVNLNTHNSWQHEFLKCKICYDLQKCGKQYITEAPLSKNGIKTCQADILVLDNATCFEIMVSETIESLRYKCQKFPNELKIYGVRSWEDYVSERFEIINNQYL